MYFTRLRINLEVSAKRSAMKLRRSDVTGQFKLRDLTSHEIDISYIHS